MTAQLLKLEGRRPARVGMGGYIGGRSLEKITTQIFGAIPLKNQMKLNPFIVTSFCASNNNYSSTACFHLHKIIGTTLSSLETVIFSPTLD